MRYLKFHACLLTIYDEIDIQQRHMKTTFAADGSESFAWPPWGKPDHIAASWHCGYGGDQWRMMMEHEIAHAFIAEELNQPHSFSVWSDAHNTTRAKYSPRVAAEEHLVTSFQRWLNVGEWDEWDKLSELSDINDAARRFLIAARPWLYVKRS